MSHFNAGSHDDEIRALAAQGYSDIAIGDRIGCTDTTVYDARQRLGIPSIPQMDDDQLKARIGRMVMEGYSDARIASRIRIPTERIRDLRESLGVAGNLELDPDEDHTDYDEIDRRALCYRLLSEGYTIAAVVDETGFQRAEVRRFKRDLPSWWRRESRRVGEGERNRSMILVPRSRRRAHRSES